VRIVPANTWRFVFDGLVQSSLALRDNGLRTLLSILGITIGIASVMAIGTISKGGNYIVLNELKTFGLNSVWVYRANDVKDPNRTLRQGTGIEVADLKVLGAGCCPAVRRMSPIAYTMGTARHVIRVGNRFSNAQMFGVGTDYGVINNDGLSAGFYFRQEDVARRRAVAIIGPTTRDDLFGPGTNPIGKEFYIDAMKFTVIGLLEHKSRDFLASIRPVEDANNRILLPYSAFHVLMGNQDIHAIQAESLSPAHAERAVTQITAVLDGLHNRRYPYKADTMQAYIGTADHILRGVSLVGVVAASVSLLVGGIGIMNVVSNSVVERTKEIGLRKAIGASQAHIMFQFLMESVMISTIGGTLGLALGAAASMVLAWVTGFPLIPSWSLIFLALAVSIMVGILSGYYPARRAARLRPVIALRYD